jgi:hypothetical protein
LSKSGYLVTTKQLGVDPLPRNVDVITCFDLKRPYLEAMNEVAYAAFQTLVKNVVDSKGGILWLTRPSQLHYSDPRWAEIISAARTIRSELDVDLATCKVRDVLGPKTWDLVT